ncbi:hypothetical protein [Sphingobacterium faecale]|uniref:Lipoprotein n=1 Tax=Sphingobacterium faecale TaxID=2803775 RepID=A0ABS1R0J1_9SPHI|nr:hypothetical protein [Sphingobacterium faecale]MBL1407830.1 hypothetical protein [Sphingobacterium faecale]
MRFRNIIKSGITVAALALFAHCSKDKNEDIVDQNIKTETFNQGTIEMGIFSQEVELSKLVGKVDFSQADPKSQYQNLLQKDKDVQAIVKTVEEIASKNPLAGLALSMNTTSCTYYVKDNKVLGKVKGFGWEMDNYHDELLDKGSLYLETLTKTSEIAESDRKIYAHYIPSKNPGAGANSNIELENFNRTELNKTEVVNGYLCNVSQLTPKAIDPDAPMNMRKLLVYTSPLFNKTINFTHPFYLEEENGILRIDIYFIDDKTPTLVMKPKNIEQRIVKNDELQSRTAQPVYTDLSAEWAFKALPIMMSGWGVLSK